MECPSIVVSLNRFRQHAVNAEQNVVRTLYKVVGLRGKTDTGKAGHGKKKRL